MLHAASVLIQAVVTFPVASETSVCLPFGSEDGLLCAGRMEDQSGAGHLIPSAHM